MFQIMIVEDDVNVRKELKMLLTNSLYEVTTVEVFDEVERQILQRSPDVARSRTFGRELAR